MRPSVRTTVIWLGALAATLGFLSAARADDWLQYRRDPQRTGASRDRVKLPLTDIWDAPGARLPVVWRGRLFTVHTGGLLRHLHCLDARTGEILWRQVLGAAPSALEWKYDPDPSVTETGIVYVHDWARGGPALRAFDGRTGRLIAGQDRGVSSEVVVQDGPRSVTRPARGPVKIGGLGLPLLIGNELLGFSHDHTLGRWTPGGPFRSLSLFHANGRGEEAKVPARLDRNVPVLTSAGVVVTGYWKAPAPLASSAPPGRDFVGLLDAVGQVRWHRELSWTPGTPVAGPGQIFFPAPGGIISLDVAGNPRWAWPRDSAARALDRPFTVQPNRELVRSQLVLTRGRIYTSRPVALDSATGALVWEPAQSQGIFGGSTAASADHLFIWGGGRLSAVNLEDGKLAWRALVPGNGELVLAGGLVFAASSTELRTLAPAERTFRLAVDSDDPARYRLVDPPDEAQREGAPVPMAEPITGLPPDAPEGEQGPAPRTEPQKTDGEKRVPGPRPDPALADSSILRLHWDEPPAERLKKARARRAMLSNRPLTLVMDWLDPTRTAPVTQELAAGWSGEQIARYSAACADLVRESRAEYLDVGPEVNVYLARRPEQLTGVRAMVRAVRKRVAEMAPDTRVLLSFNAEIHTRRYGKGTLLPFGRVILPTRRSIEELEELWSEVEVLGLTSCPQAGLKRPEEIPADYLLALARSAAGKPVLVTALSARLPEKAQEPDKEQFFMLRKIVQACYWLNARVVAYPEALAGTEDPMERKATALVVGDRPRPLAHLWREVLQWKWVERLSATLPDPMTAE